MDFLIEPKDNVSGEIIVPGDKSISHRSIMFGAISKGKTEIEGFLMGEDCLATINCFRKMGIDIEIESDKVTVYGKGLNGLSEPKEILDVQNSGTAIRLLLGLLAAQSFSSSITGDSSIQKRPMDRVMIPLKQMGADIHGLNTPTNAPLKVTGKKLNAVEYTLPVASAQVKSAVIIAGMYAEGKTIITEPEKTRDHTELMLNYFGANIERDGNKIIVNPVIELNAKNVFVPGDISSAAFFMVAASILKNSCLTIKNVGINPTRTGIITALKQMGADIELLNERTLSGEKTADILIKSSNLKAITLEGGIIPLMIDEIPVFAVAALFAEGTTIIKDAQELKVKESNRISAMVKELSKMGADIEETDDGMIIKGGASLKGAAVESYNDHRIAMSLAIAALKASGNTVIEGGECVNISFPGFYDLIKNI